MNETLVVSAPSKSITQIAKSVAEMGFNPTKPVAQANEPAPDNDPDKPKDLIDKALVREVIRKEPYRTHMATCLIMSLEKLINDANRKSKTSISVRTTSKNVKAEVTSLLAMVKGIKDLIGKDGKFTPRGNKPSPDVPHAHILYDPTFIKNYVIPRMAASSHWESFLDEAKIPALATKGNSKVPPIEWISIKVENEMAYAFRTVIQNDVGLVSYKKGLHADMDPTKINAKVNKLIAELVQYVSLETLQEIIYKHYEKPEPRGPQLLVDLGDIHVTSFDDLRTKEQRKLVYKACIAMTGDAAEFEEAEEEFMDDKMMGR